MFQQQRESWWSKFTSITDFSKKLKPPFSYRIATEGNDQADAALEAKNSFGTPPIPDKDWVRGPGVPNISPQQRIIGIDPGAKAVFTAVVHSAMAEQTLSDPQPTRYRS